MNPEYLSKQVYELQRKAYKKESHLILCTGFSDQMNEKEAKKTGIDEFLIKPINMNDLAVSIRKVLKKI